MLVLVDCYGLVATFPFVLFYMSQPRLTFAAWPIPQFFLKVVVISIRFDTCWTLIFFEGNTSVVALNSNSVAAIGVSVVALVVFICRFNPLFCELKFLCIPQ